MNVFDLLPSISLKWSDHDDRKATCLMEAVAVITGDEWGDHPKCTAHSLADLGICINDSCPNSKAGDAFRDEILKPLIPDLLNTSSVCRRTGHRDDYDVYSDEHNTKVEKFLKERLAERFKAEFPDFSELKLIGSSELKLIGSLGGMLYYMMRHQLDKAGFIHAHDFHKFNGKELEAVKPVLRIAAEVLKEGCDYAKKLLGKEANEPVTIYASEFQIPGWSDNFVNDIPTEQSTEEKHLEMHHG